MARRIFIVLFFIPIVCQAQFSEQAFKFGKVLDWINHYYVDSVDQEKLVEDAIVNMLKELDPHSVYYNKEEVNRMNEPLQGNFEGIGIQFNILKDTLFVISTISGGPSEKVGILAGDRILEVDGENIAGKGIENADVFRLLKGPKGTKVNVRIMRRNLKGLIDFTITRDRIPIYSIDAAYEIADGIGYIKLNRFAITTSNEFNEKINELKQQGINDLILDLSNNGGGYLEEAISLADQFLEGRKSILYTEGVNSPRKEYMGSVKGEFEEGRVILIIDEGSASASEIVAGAIQDWDRGVVVGRRSFGKGLVQRPLMLPDGSMVRLTIARYYTPTGRLIQKPYENGVDEYNNDLINRYNSGELSSKDSIHFPDSLKYYTLENKRVVYGGGGIMPDVFVPIDTTNVTPYYRSLIGKGLFNTFLLEYVDNNRKSLKNKYTDFSMYEESFEVDDELLKKLVDYAEKNGLAYNEEEFQISREHIKLLVKAYVARDLWNTSEFYQVLNTQEKPILKALEILQNKDIYKDKLK